MDNSAKGFILGALAILYLLLPIDLIPGCPIDDIAVIALTYITSKKGGE